ncbi:hypothetical protein [Cryobacterium roopkundense]|uniref:hypothetical protein n=1 Tax=Cryobacterium roopkundense TaxID=1001240 RepID=UPI00126A3E56|nr:hypothetical protein [Cryobacterium roopkundense]
MGGDVGRIIVLRPYKHLLRDTLTIFLAFCAPTFAVLYWLNVPQGTWAPVLIVQGFITVIYALSMIAAYRVLIRLDEDGITERGFFRPYETFPLETVGSVVLLDLYASSALDTNRQLFITDHDGKLLIRMRGQFWSPDDMDSLADEMDVPVVRVPEPMTLADLNRLRPELLYWFERRPSLRTAHEPLTVDSSVAAALAVQPLRN